MTMRWRRTAVRRRQELARVILPREGMEELPLAEAVRQIGKWEQELAAELEERQRKLGELNGQLRQAEEINRLFADLKNSEKREQELAAERGAWEEKNRRIALAEQAQRVFAEEEKYLEKEREREETKRRCMGLEEWLKGGQERLAERRERLKEMQESVARQNEETARERNRIEESLPEYRRMVRTKLLWNVGSLLGRSPWLWRAALSCISFRRSLRLPSAPARLKPFLQSQAALCSFSRPFPDIFLPPQKPAAPVRQRDAPAFSSHAPTSAASSCSRFSTVFQVSDQAVDLLQLPELSVQLSKLSLCLSLKLSACSISRSAAPLLQVEPCPYPLAQGVTFASSCSVAAAVLLQRIVKRRRPPPECLLHTPVLSRPEQLQSASPSARPTSCREASGNLPAQSSRSGDELFAVRPTIYTCSFASVTLFFSGKTLPRAGGALHPAGTCSRSFPFSVRA